MVMIMSKIVKVILYSTLSVLGIAYLLRSNHLFLSLESYAKAQANTEMFYEPTIEVVKYHGNDAIIYVQEDYYVSCYYGRKKYGIVWQSFTGIGVFREIDDLSESAIKQYKQECIDMYELNNMENW